MQNQSQETHRHTVSRVLAISAGFVAVLLVVFGVTTLRTKDESQSIAPKNNQGQTSASSSKKQLTPAKSNGYTGVAEDVLTSQSFECEARSEDEWYRTDRTFAIDPTNPDVLYVSVEYRGVYKSIDGGSTWKKSAKGIKVYADQKDRTKGCYGEYPVIRINPIDSKHLIIGLSGGGGGHLHPTNMNQQVGGVYQSFDAGENWELMIDNTMNTYLTDVAFSADGKTVYYSTASNPGSWQEADTTKLFVSKGLVYKTTDYGKSWEELPTGIGKNTTAGTVMLSKQDAELVRVPTFSAIRLSADGTGQGISTGKDTSVDQLGILQSVDGGKNWSSTKLPADEPVQRSSFSATNDKNFYLLPSPKEGMPYGYATTDGGVTFKKVQAMDVVSYDPSDTTGMRMLGFSRSAGTPTNPNVNLFESKDGGTTWKAFGTLPREITDLNAAKTRPSNIVWHPTDKNTIYMNGAGGFVWKSTNLGTLWETLLTYTEL